jgi:hypothetical protein
MECDSKGWQRESTRSVLALRLQPTLPAKPLSCRQALGISGEDASHHAAHSCPPPAPPLLCRTRLRDLFALSVESFGC